MPIEKDFIRDTLKEVMEDDLGNKYDSFSDQYSIQDDLKVDSIDVVGIVSKMALRFKIDVSGEEMDQFRTVGDVVNAIYDKVNAPVKGVSDPSGTPSAEATLGGHVKPKPKDLMP